MKQWYTISNGLNQSQTDEGREYALEKIIEFRQYPLEMILDKLLVDKTTGKRIIWATDGYSEYGDNYRDRFEITPAALIGMSPVLIQPRAFKALEAQQQRTKSKAEVFTPSWIVNKMINHLDDEWFGRSDVFNIEEIQAWKTTIEPINFKDRKWKDYVDRSVLEITCGEAPFIVSRYNASTGEIIPIENRIGVLDRKLRVVTENTNNEEDWIKWAKRAYESVYGYEYQGDNLLIGRINLLMTFVDYYQSIWKKDPDKSLLTAITNVIAWNFWQMDGLNGTVPLGIPQSMDEQMTLFDVEEEPKEKAPLCKVRKWRMKKAILHKEIEEKEGNEMNKKKWDVVIGNPPYQDETLGDNSSFAPPIYNKFIDAAVKIADRVEMIHPARFLFNAGSTPKEWNHKMLSSPHLQVLDYEPLSSKVFPNTDIKGGVAITFYQKNKLVDPIDVFTPIPELNSILKIVKPKLTETMDQIISGRGVYKLSLSALDDHPEIEKRQSKGHKRDVGTSTFKILKDIVFFEHKPDDGEEYVKVLGLNRGERVYFWIRKNYLTYPTSFEHYKVFIPKANGSGALGEVLSTPLIGAPLIGAPLIGANETFLSIGNFETKEEAEAALKYVKSKFARTMLGVLKITQDNTRDKWKYVPMQDFTTNSDIDWSVSIPEIDQQLYRKYCLSPEEINFIETHVKEME